MFCVFPFILKTKTNEKILLFGLIFCILSGTAAAQHKSVLLGFKIAPNLGWMYPDTKHYSYQGTRAGFSFGFVSDFALTDNYFFSTGFNMNYLNGKLRLPHFEMSGNDSIKGNIDRIYNLHYIEIPLMFKMKTNEFGKFRFFAEIGFGTSFRIKAKAKDTFNAENKAVIKENSDITKETRLMKESLLVGIGTEYMIDKSTFIFMGINFSNGLTNVLKGTNALYPDIEPKAMNHYLELNLGVIF